MAAFAQGGVPAPTGLVSWWPGEGNANDIVGTNHGTVIGGVTYTKGEVGQAFSFDGNTGYVSIPDAPSLDAFTTNITIETWIKANQTNANGDWESIVSKGNAAWEINATPGAKTLTFALTGPNPNIVTGSRNVNDGQWHHVAGLYNGTNIYLYVDGALDASTQATGLISPNHYPMGIGYNAQGPFGYPTYFYNGAVDEVSIYNRALSSNEIAAIYSAGVGGKYLSAIPPTVTNQPLNQAVWIGSNVTFTVGVSGTGPFYYQWLFNSNSISTNNIITTLAGGGTGGGTDGLGDGGAATNAILNQPFGSMLSLSGNILFGDSGHNLVRKVDTNGIITIVAGGGTDGLGDGGTATNATLEFPDGVAVDSAGNLYIEDSVNWRIRKVDTNGIITTFAGGGLGGGTDGLGDGGAATNAIFNYCHGLAFDSAGRLFIADWGNSRVRKVDTNGVITTVAGGGAGGGTDGLGDGGAATNATLNEPVGLAFDAFDNLYIGDGNNHRVRKVNTNGIITTVAGGGAGGGVDGLGDGGAATNASLGQVNGVAVDSLGNLFIADSDNNRIREVNTDGVITTVVGGGVGGGTDGLGDGGVATNATLNWPHGISVDSLGNLFIADYNNNRVRKVAVNYNGAPTLTLNNVTTANAGYYQVVVTSPYGSVTSHLASLTVNVPARTATGVAILDYGFLVHVIVTDGGYGYTNSPTVLFVGGGGSGAQAVAVVSNGVVTAVNVIDAGYGYTNAPLVIIEPPLIPNPILSIVPISFLSFSNLSVGSTYQLQRTYLWYWTNQFDSFMAADTAYTLGLSTVAAVGEYRLALAPVPNQAFATAQVVNHFVVGAPLTSDGSGYVTAPAVSIIGGGGAGATAVAQISGGVVTNIMITGTGSGYTNLPTVEIAPPPAAALSPTLLPGMRLDAADLVPYVNYQIQFTPDVAGGWMNWDGGLFSSTGATNSQFIIITNDTGIFRLQYAP